MGEKSSDNFVLFLVALLAVFCIRKEEESALKFTTQWKVHYATA